MEIYRISRGGSTISDNIRNSSEFLKNFDTFKTITRHEEKEELLHKLKTVNLEIILQDELETDLKRNNEVIAFIITNLSIRFFQNVNFIGNKNVLKHRHLGDYLIRKLEMSHFESDPTHSIIIGTKLISRNNSYFLTSSGWSIYYSKRKPCNWKEIVYNPLLASFTGAFGFGELYKDVMKDLIFGIDIRDEFIFSFTNSNIFPENKPEIPSKLDIDLTMVGCGGVGQSIAYLLQFFDLHGQIRFIDHDKIEKSNLQRYLLTCPKVINFPKVILLNNYFENQQFLYRRYNLQQWGVALTLSPELFYQDEIFVSIDNKRSRNEIQAALPKIIWNSWTGTAPGELRYGFGKHKLNTVYQCLACVYFPKEENPGNQMEFNAKILGLTEEELEEKIKKNAIFQQEDLDYTLNHYTLSKDHYQKIRQLIGNSFKDIFHGHCGLLQGKLGEGHDPTPAPHIPTLSASVLMIYFILDKLGINDNELEYTVGEYSGFHYPTKFSLFRVKKNEKCFCNEKIYKNVYCKKWSKKETK
ncbi:MAG: hypothetical protein HeimC3_53360 [Candidatus Heimdallarchaeota archaeon LC_3]|nr:MAG: hypothetical protein HeimC3_53360 [Candidatus Heimdallarchaeota archaeon LC_3]